MFISWLCRTYILWSSLLEWYTLCTFIVNCWKKSLNAKFKKCFGYLLVPVANNTIIQVWIESEKVGGQWQFHDGSPIPDTCPILMSNGTEEIHLRAKGSTSFICLDAPNSTYHYSCEYHRLLALNNQH